MAPAAMEPAEEDRMQSAPREKKTVVYICHAVIATLF